MQSNIDKSAAAFNKFGIQPYSKIIEPMLKKNSIEGSVLFFEFQHLDNQLKCRLAFESLDKKLHYETYLEFDFNTSNPIYVSYYGSYNDGLRPRKNGFRTADSLWGLTQLDVDILVDSLLQKK